MQTRSQTEKARLQQTEQVRLQQPEKVRPQQTEQVRPQQTEQVHHQQPNPLDTSENIDYEIELLQFKIDKLKNKLYKLTKLKQKRCKHTNKIYRDYISHGYGCFSTIYECPDCNERIEI